ncbi:MAG: hypothetical protein ACYDEJ_02870 [Desulfitobacteriaceae bacterium]
MAIEYFEPGLVLAAEDFSDELFEQFHTFSQYAFLQDNPLTDEQPLLSKKIFLKLVKRVIKKGY